MAWPPSLREDRGVSRAVETLAVLLVSTGVVLAVVEGPAREQVSCLAESTIVRLESSGGAACGGAVPRTRPDGQPVRAKLPAADREPAQEADRPTAPRARELASVSGGTGQKGTVAGMAAGDQVVPGLGARKQKLIAAGATVEDLAVAMLENDTMTSNYAYGDGKGGDSTNFGVFKQNWGMLAASNPDLAAAGIAASGQRLNSDPGADIAALHASRAYYGDAWVSGHRNGASGLANPSTKDIGAYESAVAFIAGKLRADPSLLRDDTRIWVDVPAI